MMSVFGLVGLNSNDHDVITIIKQSLSVFGFGFLCYRPNVPSLVIKLTTTLPNFQLAVSLLYKVVWP